MCSPDGASRGAAFPSQAKTASDFVTTAPSSTEVAVTRRVHRRSPDVPDAVSIAERARRRRRCVARSLTSAAPGATRTRHPCSRVSAMPLAAAKPALIVVTHATAWRDTGPTDVRAVGARARPRGRVDDHLHLARGDHLDGVDPHIAECRPCPPASRRSRRASAGSRPCRPSRRAESRGPTKLPREVEPGDLVAIGEVT